MPEYIEFPVVTDIEDLQEQAFNYLRAKIQGWQPSDGQLDVWLIEAGSLWAADIRDALSEMTTSIFRYFGSSLMGIDPVLASPATVTVTVTAKDSQGYTLNAGTLVGYTNPSGDVYAFQVMNTVVIPPGSTATAAGAVTLASVDPGSAASGLGAAGAAMQMIDPLDWVVSVVMTAATAGGQDAEADDAYLDRLTTELHLMTPRPILPADFAALANRISGVARSIAIDGYNPTTDTYNNARMVSIAALDFDGNPVSSVTKAAIASYLQSLREVTFVVNMIDPSITAVDVTYAAVMLPNRNAVAVNAAITAALQEYLSTANWGVSQSALGGWYPQNSVRLYEIATIINNVDGVNYVGNITIGLNGGAQSATDFTLAGAAPLAAPGTISGSVT